jgi:hypothetical protein
VLAPPVPVAAGFMVFVIGPGFMVPGAELPAVGCPSIGDFEGSSLQAGLSSANAISTTPRWIIDVGLKCISSARRSFN